MDRRQNIAVNNNICSLLIETGKIFSVSFIMQKRRMLMYNLSQFQQFDFSSFQQGKKFMITGAKYNENKKCITLDVAIVEDHTQYGEGKKSNLFEKFKVHLVKSKFPMLAKNYKEGEVIRFTAVGKCTVWGDYNSNLSVEAEVEVVKDGNQ